MDNTQAYQIIDKIKKLWQAWKPSEDEQILYCRKLTLFEYDTAVAALEEHKSSKQGSGLNPKLHHILEICKGKGLFIDKKNTPVVNYEVVCIEHKEMPWRVGERQKFWVTDRKYLYHGAKQEAASIKSAEAVGGCMGGTWIPRLINFDIDDNF